MDPEKSIALYSFLTIQTLNKTNDRYGNEIMNQQISARHCT